MKDGRGKRHRGLLADARAAHAGGLAHRKSERKKAAPTGMSRTKATGCHCFVQSKLPYDFSAVFLSAASHPSSEALPLPAVDAVPPLPVLSAAGRVTTTDGTGKGCFRDSRRHCSRTEGCSVCGGMRWRHTDVSGAHGMQLAERACGRMLTHLTFIVLPGIADML